MSDWIQQGNFVGARGRPRLIEAVKVAEKTGYTMAQRSRLPALKARGLSRFKRVDIHRWIEQQKGASRDEGRN